MNQVYRTFYRTTGIDSLLMEVIRRTWLQVDPLAELNRKLLTSFPVLGMYMPPTFPILEAISRTYPCENKMLLRPFGLNM